jgi:hypothetical protein
MDEVGPSRNANSHKALTGTEADVVLVAEIRDRDLIREMPPENGGFLLRRELLPFPIGSLRRLLRSPNA